MSKKAEDPSRTCSRCYALLTGTTLRIGPGSLEIRLDNQARIIVRASTWFGPPPLVGDRLHVSGTLVPTLDQPELLAFGGDITRAEPTAAPFNSVAAFGSISTDRRFLSALAPSDLFLPLLLGDRPRPIGTVCIAGSLLPSEAGFALAPSGIVSERALEEIAAGYLPTLT